MRAQDCSKKFQSALPDYLARSARGDFGVGTSDTVWLAGHCSSTYSACMPFAATCDLPTGGRAEAAGECELSTSLLAADKILLQLAAQPGDTNAVKTVRTALVAKFVAHEMNANFVTHLQSDRAAVDTANVQLESSREDSVGNTATLGPLIARGVQIVTTLDAIMHNKYAVCGRTP